MKDNNKKVLVKFGICSDGGSHLYFLKDDLERVKTLEEANLCNRYYIDYKAGSLTLGELYLNYPTDDNSILLNKEDFILQDKQ
jgi:hypothetical protein